MIESGRFFEGIPEAAGEEVFQQLAVLGGARIERIVSTGQSSPPGFWYDQEWDEWVIVLQGAATLRFQEPEEVISLSAGDWVLIPARRRHRVDCTEAEPRTVWLAVHGRP